MSRLPIPNPLVSVTHAADVFRKLKHVATVCIDISTKCSNSFGNTCLRLSMLTVD